MDTVIVKNSQFYSHCQKRIAKGNVNAEKIEIRLDSEWDGLTVRIHWLNVDSGVEKVVLLERDKPNTIPWEVLADLGELRMGLVGLDGETVIKPTIWLSYGYVSDGVDPESGDDPQPPTPSWEQQMVALAEAAANAAKAAKETADNLQASAEAGEFNGDPGPAGPPGKSPIIQDGNWWLWDVEAQEYRDTGIAASGGGGGGTTNYQDLSNKPSINGVELLGNKTAQDLGLQPNGDYATTSSKLANPFSLTFTGAVEATYDGSEEKTVTIPTIAGPPGVSPTVSTEEIDGGTRVTFTFQGGSETVDLLNGKDGKAPVKGVDYFTEEEIQDVAKQAAALVPGGGGSGESHEWRLIRTITAPEDPTTDQSGVTWFLNSVGKINGFEVTADDNGDPFRLDEVIICGSGVFYPDSGTRGNLEIYTNSLYRVYLGYRNLYQGNVRFAIFQNQITGDKSLPYSYEQEVYFGSTLFTPYGAPDSKIPFTYVGPATRVLWKTSPNTHAAEPNFYMENFKIYLYGRVKNES